MRSPLQIHRNSWVVSHLRIHTEDKPFSCTLCPMSFAQHSTLKAHTINHTGDCVLPPQQRRELHTRWAERGWGLIFWETRDIGLPSCTLTLSAEAAPLASHINTLVLKARVSTLYRQATRPLPLGWWCDDGVLILSSFFSEALTCMWLRRFTYDASWTQKGHIKTRRSPYS